MSLGGQHCGPFPMSIDPFGLASFSPARISVDHRILGCFSILPGERSSGRTKSGHAVPSATDNNIMWRCRTPRRVPAFDSLHERHITANATEELLCGQPHNSSKIQSALLNGRRRRERRMGRRLRGRHTINGYETARIFRTDCLRISRLLRLLNDSQFGYSRPNEIGYPFHTTS